MENNNGTINGATYSSDIEQSCQLTTVNGCDSVAVLNLIINNSNSGILIRILLDRQRTHLQTILIGLLTNTEDVIAL